MATKKQALDLQALVSTLTPEQLATLKTLVKPTREKKEKVIVATRIQLVDTPDTAKKVRKAGERFDLTEQGLLATLKTWVRGKDAEALIQANIMALAGGATLDFGKFQLEGVKRELV